MCHHFDNGKLSLGSRWLRPALGEEAGSRSEEPQNVHQQDSHDKDPDYASLVHVNGIARLVHVNVIATVDRREDGKGGVWNGWDVAG
jgi:hypothetical protein